MSRWLSSSLSSAFSSFSGSRNHDDQDGEEEELDDAAISIRPPTKERLELRANGSRGSSSSNQSQQHSFSLASLDPPSIHVQEAVQALPSTPPTQTIPSPRTRANDSGSLILSSILESHPQFSVFRKSTSFPSDLDAQVDSPTPFEDVHSHGTPARSPAVLRRIERDFPESPTLDSPPTNGDVRDQSEEWHLSSLEEMASLDFGETSSHQPSPRSTHLVDMSSPPNRLPSPHHLSPSPPAPNHSHHPQTPRTPSSALSRSVQFSPLGLAPSPLLTRPPLPEPSPALDYQEWGGLGFDDSPTNGGVLSSNGKGILKAPRTPGTGRSVRFSASTVAQKESLSPEDELERFADPTVEYEQGDEEDEEGEGDSGASAKSVATFLQKLHAAIPSPETSFDQPGSTPSSEGESRRTSASSAMSVPRIKVQGDQVEASISNLFDVSAPDYEGRDDSNSLSLERFEVATTEIHIGSPGTEERTVDRRGEGSVETTKTAYTSTSSFGNYGTPLGYDSPDSSPSPASFQDAEPESERKSFKFDFADTSVDSPSPSFSSPLATASASPSPSRRHRTPSPSPPKPRKHSQFYREFLKKRAGTSTVAAENLVRIVSEEGKTPSPVGVGPSPGRKRRLEEEEGGRETPLKVEDENMEYYSPVSAPASAFANSEEVSFDMEKSTGSIIEKDTGSIIEKEADDSTDDDEFDARRAFGSFASTTATPTSVPPLSGSTLAPDGPATFVPIAEFLSPIYEESEPNTTVDLSMRDLSMRDLSLRSPDSASGNRSNRSNNSHAGRRKSSISILRQLKEDEPSSSISNALVQANTSPRRSHQRSQSAICVASPNPFGASSDLNLVHSLLSAQGDMLANTSSQKFLLSSLITNMREDLDRKDSMIRNLLQQKEVMEKDRDATLEMVDKWEQEHRVKENSQVAGLEDLVVRLTAELETRTALERSEVKRVDEELRTLRVQASQSRSDHRDSEIRLRHARASQNEAEEGRFKVETERDLLKEAINVEKDQSELLRRERDDLHARLRREREENDHIIATLKNGLVKAEGIDASDEVERRVKAVQAEASREVILVKNELESQASNLAAQAELIDDLRTQNRLLREDAALASEEARRNVQALQLELLDARTEADRFQEEVTDLRDERQQIGNQVDEVTSRLETVEEAKAREVDQVRAELDSYKTSWQETRVAHDQLVDAVAKMEAAAADKVATLDGARQELAAWKKESNALLDDRDRRLAKAETALASRSAKYDSLENECNRLKELVAVLRRESADREVKVIRLQKMKIELQEDVDGLNIALDAKQQEVSLYKRQVAASRIPTRYHSSLSNVSNASANTTSLSSIASNQLLPSAQKSGVNRTSTPAVTRSRGLASPAASVFEYAHDETPSKVAQPPKKPSLGFGSSSRRVANEPVLVEAPKAPKSIRKSSKENVSPRKRATSDTTTSSMKRQMELA